MLTQLLIGYLFEDPTGILPRCKGNPWEIHFIVCETYHACSEFTSSVIISAAGREVHELNDWMVAGKVIKLNGGYA